MNINQKLIEINLDNKSFSMMIFMCLIKPGMYAVCVLMITNGILVIY